MKSLTVFFLAFVLGKSVSFAQSTENRSVSGFEKVAVSGAWDVYLKEGSEEGVRLEGDKDLIEKMVTEVEGNTLKIHKKKGERWNWGNNSKLKIYVTYKTLKAIVNSGSNDVYGQSTIKGDEFSIVCSGSGDIELDLDVEELDLVISGSSGVDLKGEAGSQKIVISGSGDVDAADLASKTASITVSGSGNVKVNASESLEGRISGSGDLHYKGNPSIKVKVSGSGDIQKI